jgi:hypothetical protein
LRTEHGEGDEYKQELPALQKSEHCITSVLPCVR